MCVESDSSSLLSSSLLSPHSCFSLCSVLASLSKTTGRTARCTTEEEAIEEAMSAPGGCAHHLWDLDMTFSDSHRLAGLSLQFPNGLIDCCEEVMGWDVMGWGVMCCDVWCVDNVACFLTL
jgi:hypothetical protein